MTIYQYIQYTIYCTDITVVTDWVIILAISGILTTVALHRVITEDTTEL